MEFLNLSLAKSASNSVSMEHPGMEIVSVSIFCSWMCSSFLDISQLTSFLYEKHFMFRQDSMHYKRHYKILFSCICCSLCCVFLFSAIKIARIEPLFWIHSWTLHGCLNMTPLLSYPMLTMGPVAGAVGMPKGDSSYFSYLLHVWCLRHTR